MYYYQGLKHNLLYIHTYTENLAMYLYFLFYTFNHYRPMCCLLFAAAVTDTIDIQVPLLWIF